MDFDIQMDDGLDEDLNNFCEVIQCFDEPSDDEFDGFSTVIHDDEVLEEESEDDEVLDPLSLPTQKVRVERKFEVVPEGWKSKKWVRGGADLGGKDHPFLATPGMTEDVPSDADELFFLQRSLTDGVVEDVTKETNIYGSNYLHVNSEKIMPSSTCKMWPEHGTNMCRVWIFIALQFFFGLVKKSVLRDYWVTDSIMSTPFPSSVMPRNEFMNIMQFLHLFDSDGYIPRGEIGYDPRQKLGQFYTSIQNAFSSMWVCRQSLSVDEGTIPYKGRVHFKCFNPSKPDKYHLKTFKVCDSSNGYCHSFDLYTGSNDNDVSPFGKVHDTVLNLMVPFAHMGYSVYMDNYYTSPYLFYHLERWNILATGTSRPRKGYPKEVFTDRLREKGESTAFSYDDSMNVLRVMDRKKVTFLTSEHNIDLIPTGKVNYRSKEKVMKPEVMVMYNKYMGGVDRNDQLCKYSAFSHRALKWWKKVFFRILNLCMVNAYIMYIEWCSSQGKPKIKQLQFRRNVIAQIVAKYGSESARPVQRSVSHSRLTGRHFPANIPQNNPKRRITLACVVCRPALRKLAQQEGKESKKRPGSESSYHCKQCDKALCVVPCFELYHTYTDYETAYINWEKESNM